MSTLNMNMNRNNINVTDPDKTLNSKITLTKNMSTLLKNNI